MYRYLLEMVVPYNNSWRWKQVAVSNDLEQLKRVAGNKHRILDIQDSLKEVFRTASEYHAGIMFQVNGY